MSTQKSRKLWAKGYSLDKDVETFTVGDDYILDRELIKYDVYGSIAHSAGLKRLGILTAKEFKDIQMTLIEILKLDEKDKFVITREDEDVHTAIENFLVKRLGNTGKKIHTGRSRNDQVLTAIRLYCKYKLFDIHKAVLNLCKTLRDRAIEHRFTPIPGYTHMQPAMVSSVGLWATAFLESLLDDLEVLKTAYKLNNQSPLGSASGYGVPLKLARDYTARLLSFEKPQCNVLYVQNSRGKIESIILSALSQIMLDLNKLATDILLFSTREFGYFKIPENFCTGSSLMPQKRNPDVLELVRARYGLVLSCEFGIKQIISSLPSGYNRDFQLTKGYIMQALQYTYESVKIIDKVLSRSIIDKAKCLSGCTPDIFATDSAIKLAKYGVPFREAYKKSQISDPQFPNPVASIRERKSIGAPGNLMTEKSLKVIAKALEEINVEQAHFDKSMSKLLQMAV